MSSVVISGDTSGAITLAAPSVAGTNTATLPASTGTVMVSGNMPAFSAYPNPSTSMGNNTFTKITINTIEFDTNNNFNTSTNRFTPNVAGYYYVGGQWSTNANGVEMTIAIYKNGSNIKQGADIVATNTYSVSVNSIIYMNGSTDYLELYGYVNASGKTTGSNGRNDFFYASLIRGA